MPPKPNEFESAWFTRFSRGCERHEIEPGDGGIGLVEVERRREDALGDGERADRRSRPRRRRRAGGPSTTWSSEIESLALGVRAEDVADGRRLLQVALRASRCRAR